MVFQQPLLLKWRRIIDNVLLPAEILGLPMAESRERARDLLALVGLKGNEDKYPYELSGGMQQRAAIARALVHDPKLILMDEPFGALDALTREKMNLELLRIWEEAKKTIVFVTHGITEAVFLGTRVVVLTAGPARMADNFRVELPHPRTLDMKTQREIRRIHPADLPAAWDGMKTEDRRRTTDSHTDTTLDAHLPLIVHISSAARSAAAKAERVDRSRFLATAKARYRNPEAQGSARLRARARAPGHGVREMTSSSARGEGGDAWRSNVSASS